MDDFLTHIKNAIMAFAAFFSSPSTGVIFLLILALIIFLIVFYVFFYYSKKKPKDREAEQKKEMVRQEEELTSVSFADKTLFLGRRFSEYLNKRGFFRLNPLNLSFLKSLRFLEETIGGTSPKYKLPWYMVLGSEGSGKSSLIQNSSLFHHSLQHPDHKNLSPKCTFHLLREGVLLDIQGDTFLKKDPSLTLENVWRAILVLLKRYRSARPLDGIVLTLPLSDFYKKTHEDLNELMEQARLTSQKISTLQSFLGIRLPVYVILTKTDIIPGFEELCSLLPEKVHDQMIGWSNPNTLTTSYNKTWINDAFISITETLYKIQHEMFDYYFENEKTDNIFLFPIELNTVAMTVETYLSHIFSETTYSESPLFRGLYITGQTYTSALNAPTQKGGLFSRIGTLFSSSRISTPIFFINHVFQKKIFKEQGIVTPLEKQWARAKKLLQTSKVCSAALFVFCLYGSFRAYERFLQTREQFIPVLNRINADIKEMRDDAVDHTFSTVTFNQYSAQLFEMMRFLDETSFFSVFIPASWFSSLSDRLYGSLKMSYQETVIKSIYISLSVKMASLTDQKIQDTEFSMNPEHFLNPLHHESFLSVRKYVTDIHELIKNINRFNNLKVNGDLKELNELLKFNFNTEIPEQYWKRYGQMRNFIKNIDLPDINIGNYNQICQEGLKKRYSLFLKHMFTKEPKSFIGSLFTFFNHMNNSKLENFVDYQHIRQFSSSFIASPLLAPGQNWIDTPYFSPGKELDDLFHFISNSTLLGKIVAQELIDETSNYFSQFQRLLVDVNRLLIPSEKKHSRLYPSQGLVDLQKSLQLLFNEPYMSIPTENTFSVSIPFGYIIRFDPHLVQAAYEMTKRYDEFTSRHLKTFPTILKENIEHFSRINLQHHIKSLIGRSQTFIKLEQIDSLAAEEMLRSQIQDVKNVFPYFLKLLEVLNRGSSGNQFVELRDLLGTISFSILENIEKLLTSVQPFHIRSFDFWEGNPGAAIQAYGLKDNDDLKFFIETQRQQVVTLTNDFAKPIIRFLSSPLMMDFDMKRPLIQRWKRIVESVDDYTKRNQMSSLAEIERFIILKLNQYDLSQCLSDISITDTQQLSGDYFKETLHVIQKTLLSRAEILQRQRSVKSYNDLKDYFNRYIRERFPFVGLNARLDTPDVDLETLREFFKRFDLYGGSAHKILDQVYQLEGGTESALTFLQDIEQVKEFLGPSMASQDGCDLPTFDVNFEFRVNREQERKAENILDFEISLEEGSKLDRYAKNKTARWVLGNPIEVRLLWPKRASEEPTLDPSQPYLEYEENDRKVVTYRYSGQWALLWMLRLQSAGRTEQINATNPFSRVIKFTVPLSEGARSVIFHKIILSQPPVTSNAKGKSVKCPTFPLIAPTLPNEVTAVMDRAVLVDKKSKAMPRPQEKSLLNPQQGVRPVLFSQQAPAQGGGIQPLQNLQSLQSPAAVQGAGMPPQQQNQQPIQPQQQAPQHPPLPNNPPQQNAPPPISLN